MYNYSGIWFRIWSACGILALISIINLLFSKPWKKKLKIRDLKVELGGLTFAILMVIFYLSRIIFPDTASYTGAFQSEYRDSGASSPLPVIYGYCFWNGEGKKPTFYLDIYSKRKIFPEEFNKEQEYTIYYDKLTNVIVKVDVVE